MNEEIKEILDKFNRVLENYELEKKFGQLSVDSICHLFPSELITIKDYITNLQEENERLKEENNRLYDLCESNNISYLKGIEDAKQLNDYKYDGFVEKWLKEMKEKLQRGD